MAHPLEALYPFVPAWVQNAGISLWGLSWKRKRLGGDFNNNVAAFSERDRWSKDQMQAYLNDVLRSRMLRAYSQVPYYRKTWKEAGIDTADLEKLSADDLWRLPETPKSDLRANPDDFVAEDSRRQKKLYRYASSGSTGTPITMICDPASHRRFVAAREVRSFGWAGTSVRSPRSMIGGRLVVPRGSARPPYYRYNWAERQVYFSAYHIAPKHVRNYVDGFNKHRPRLLTGYAYSHYILARMMVEQGLTLDYKPEAVILSSEKTTSEMKGTIEAAFGCRAYEEYGAVENCVLGTECEAGRLHASPDFGVLEIVDNDGRAVPPGAEGRIICTSLLNDAQYLFRYQIGDSGIWSDETCGCGRDHLPVLKEITGRLEDVVVGPDGREMVRFHGIFIDLKNVMEGQVIQEDLDDFTVKLVANPSFGPKDEQLINNRFCERLGPVKVNIERVDHIPRTERGKYRAVVSNLKRNHPHRFN